MRWNNMGAKKTVMLTGASGHMGFHGFKELYAKKDKFNLVLLLRGSEKNRVKFKDFENDPSVRIVWGDLTNYEDVLNAVTGSDYILHVGGMVSPAADWKPYRTQNSTAQNSKNIPKTNIPCRRRITSASAGDIILGYLYSIAERFALSAGPVCRFRRPRSGYRRAHGCRR